MTSPGINLALIPGYFLTFSLGYLTQPKVFFMQEIGFCESALKEYLDQLPKQAKMAFAVACAQRIFPYYEKYAIALGPTQMDIKVFAEAFSYVLNNLISNDVDASTLQALLNRCMRVLPSEEDAWENGLPYAEDATAVIIYCIRLLLTGDTQEAVWAAKRIYEAVDSFVINAYQVDVNNVDGEKFILNHPIVRNELTRQVRDLEELANAKGSLQELKDVALLVINRAKLESISLFS